MFFLKGIVLQGCAHYTKGQDGKTSITICFLRRNRNKELPVPGAVEFTEIDTLPGP